MSFRLVHAEPRASWNSSVPMDDAAHISPLDGEHIASIVTWLCLTIATLAIASRFAVKWAVSRKFGLDDALVIVAFVFSILSGLAVTVEICHGLDYQFSQLSSKTIEIQLLSAYLGRIFYLTALTFAKLSIVAFIRHISPVAFHRHMTTGSAVFITILWIAEIFAVAFQCSLPRPWDTLEAKCINLKAYWDFVGSMNIFTDVGLVFLAFWVTKDLQMPTKRKAVVLACFAARLVDVGATTVQLLYTSAFVALPSEPHMWEFVMLTQIVQCVTIVTSCIPYLRRLLESLPSGMYLSDELRRRAMHSQEPTQARGSGYPMKYIERQKSGYVGSPRRQSRASTSKHPHSSILTSIFTRTDVSHIESESVEHINVETKVSRSVTVSTTGRPRELSQGNISVVAPSFGAPESEPCEELEK